MTALAKTSIAEWRKHWTLVLAACVGFSFMSFMTSAAGVFMQPLGAEFGWSRTQLSLGIALSGVFSILLAPFVGILIDRWGTRRLALPGLVLTGMSVAAFSLATDSFVLWLVLWAIWGLCALSVMSTVWATAVASVFKQGRGLALAITMAGTALATMIGPPLANGLIGTVGWRGAFIWLGLGWGAVAFVLSWFFLFDAHNYRAGTSKTSEDAMSGLAVSAAWRDSSLLRIALSTFLILTITIAVVVHQFPIIVEAGLDSDSAAWLVSLSGLAGIVGKIVTGFLIDRVHARWVGGITLASTAIAYPLLMEGVAVPALIVVGVAISGYAAGTKIQLCGYLTARYGGIRNYGAIFGIMTSAISLASVVGPVLAGVVHDRTGSYALLLEIGVALSLASGFLIFSLGPYPDWDSEIGQSAADGAKKDRAVSESG